MKKWIVGIDIGGTKTALCLGTSRGRIISKRLFPTKEERGVEGLMRKIDGVVQELVRERGLRLQQVAGIGVAVPGAIAASRKSVIKAPHLRALEGYPLHSVLQRQFGLPVTIENDANACALAEAYFGLGRGIPHFVYVTISTGIGSGIVSNGTLVRGYAGVAGEVGHTTVVRNGLPCPCGKRGCLETYASGTAIANHVKRALRNGAKSRFFKGVPLNQITGQLVSEAAAYAKDRIAIQARRLAADFLGIGLANVINLLNPKRLILGGGVMEHVEYFWGPMMKAVRREAWPLALRGCEIVRSKLGKNVGDLGAIALVIEGRKRSFLRP